MKILYWAEFFWPSIGGVETQSRHLIHALLPRGYEFQVVASHHPSAPAVETIWDGTVVHRYRFQDALAQRDLRAIKEIGKDIARLKREFEPDVVHLNTVFASTFFHQITQQVCPAPLVVSVHFPIPLFDTANGLPLKILRSADWVTAVSKDSLSHVRAVAPEITGRSSLIYNGLPMPDREPCPAPLSPLLFLYLGQLVAHKGVDIALQAFALVRDQLRGARLIIAGDGAERSNLEALVAQLGIAEQVEFRGWIASESVPDLLDAATFLLMPSRSEPFGLTALEAAQMARPIVASRVDGLVEVVVDGETGILVEPENPQALAKAMVTLVENPPLIASMGAKARQRAEDVFSLEKMTDAYSLLYERLAGGHRG